MQWLWIPSVALVSLFFLVLCWYFFSDYQCFPCPCHIKRDESSTLPTVDPRSVFTVPVERHSFRTSFIRVPPPVPSSYLPTAPSTPPSTPEESPTIPLTHGNKKLRNIIYDDSGIPTLDLHDMTVPESKSAFQGFLHRQRMLGASYIQVITGRGIHSEEGIPKIKPMIKNMIVGDGLQYRETCKEGGSFDDSVKPSDLLVK